MLDNKAVLSRVVPFGMFLVLIALEPFLFSLHLDLKWHYSIRILTTLLLLHSYKRQYTELVAKPRLRDILTAVLVGFFVFLIWIIPYPDFLGVLSDEQSSNQIAKDKDNFLLLIRFLGSALIVPIMEELFWRSFLTRRLDQVHFLHLEPQCLSFYSIVVSSLLFASVHQLWFAGFVAGIVYCYLYKHFHNLWVSIIAHITTNVLVGIWVIHFENWKYW